MLPLFLTGELDVSGATFGLVVGVFPFAACAGRFIAGKAADTLGRRRTLLAGLIGAALAALLFVLPAGVLSLLVARLLQGLAHALVSIGTVVWIIDVTEPRNRERALSVLGSAIWGGTTVGVLVGGLLGDLRLVGVLGVTGSLLGVALIWTLEPPAPFPRPARTRRAFVARPVLLPAATFALASLGYGAMVGFVVVHLTDRGIDGTVALVTFTATVLAGRFVAVPLALRAGLSRSLPTVLVLSAAGLVTTAAAGNLPAAVVGALAVGLGSCVMWPVLGSIVAARTPPDERGGAIGALAAAYDIAIALSSLLFGLWVTDGRTVLIFLTAAGSALLAAVLGFLVGRRNAPLAPLGEPDPAG